MKNERQLSFSDFRWAEKGTNTNIRINMYYFSNTRLVWKHDRKPRMCIRVQFSSLRFAAPKAFCDGSMQKMLRSLSVLCQEPSSSSSSSLREARLHFLNKLRNVGITNGMERERESRCFLETGKLSRAELVGRNTNGKWNGTHIRIK